MRFWLSGRTPLANYAYRSAYLLATKPHESVEVAERLGVARSMIPCSPEARLRADLLLQTLTRAAPKIGEWLAIAEFRSVESPIGKVEFARLSMKFRHGVRSSKRSVSSRRIFDIPLSAVGDLMDAIIQDTVDLDENVAMPTRPLSVLLAPQAAGMLAHEIFGHGLEIDNVVRGRGLPLDIEFPSSFEVREISGTEGALWGLLDDDGVAATNSALVQEGRIVGLIGRDADTHLLSILPRARSTDWRTPPIGRVGDIAILPTMEGTSELERSADLAVEEVDNARLMHRTRTIEMDFSRASLMLNGEKVGTTIAGTVKIDLLNLGPHSFLMGNYVRDHLALCDKAGQRIPVGVRAPEILLRDVTVF